ncbi:hypothetical protein EMPS_06495 [Entomortierella parvispora]|uniref:Uncharacterized protein n=1 Tax=Entomortierella parvispora TaxID=205924 RepID=A0A9P3LXI1_9FUNG|nr:hypothetical protein EMPS_06495 [Entomortierella parvispora]
MSDSKLLAPTSSAQEQSHHIADQERAHRFALSLFRDQQQQQQQQQQDSAQGQPMDLQLTGQSNAAFHNHEQPLDAMTSKYILEELTKGAATISPEGQILMQLGPHQRHDEEEIDIFDYIHAKQEDEDEQEAEESGAMEGLEGVMLSPEFSSSSSPSATSFVDPPSPSWSSSSASALSPTSCSSPSPSADQDGSYSSGLSSRQEGSPEVYIKQEHQDGDYMDSSMDLYGSSALLHSRPDMDVAPPTQDLFRMLMEELQTQATVQREKFFTATTGSGTGMDSVDFLFNRQSDLESSATEEASFLKEEQEQPQQPGALQATDQEQPFMRPATDETGSESCLGSASAQEQQGLNSSSTGVKVAVTTTLHNGITKKTGNNNRSNKLDDQTMTAVDPEHNAPPSPSASLSSSGSVTPELTSPALLPVPLSFSSSFSLNSTSSSSSLSADAASLSSSSLPSSRSDATGAGTSSTSQEKPPFPQLSKPPVSIAPKVQRPSSLSPLTDMSFRSAIEQHNARRRASEVEASKEESALQENSSSRKRKLSRQVDTATEAVTPPSPTGSSKKGSPLPALDISLATEAEKRTGHQNQPHLATVDIRKEPLTPTSPVKEAGEMMDVDTESFDTTTDNTSVSVSLTSLSTNSNAKRPWTNEEEKLLLKLVESNAAIKDIAETLNRSVHSVRSRRQVLTDPGFVKGNGHAQPRRSRPDPSSKLPTYSQMAFLSLARLPELEGTLNDVASMVERLFSRHLNRIPRTGHKNLQIWRAQISDALAHEKGHPRPRFESFGIKRGRQWVYRLTDFGKGVVEAMGGVEQICDDLLKNNESFLAAEAANAAADGQGGHIEAAELGGPAAGLGHGNGYGYSYSAEASLADSRAKAANANGSSGKKSGSASAKKARATKGSSLNRSSSSATTTASDETEDTGPDSAIAKAMAAMATGLARMMAAEDEKSGSGSLKPLSPLTSTTAVDESDKAKMATKSRSGKKAQA